MKHVKRVSVSAAQLPESHTIWFFLENLEAILTDTQRIIWLHIKVLAGLEPPDGQV